MSAITMSAAAGYLRVSTSEQGRSGLGLTTQLTRSKFWRARRIHRQVLVSGCGDRRRRSSSASRLALNALHGCGGFLHAMRGWRKSFEAVRKM
jgi:hypothetical protein